MSEEKQPSLKEILRTISAIINENRTSKIEIKLGIVVAVALALCFAWRYITGNAL